ncbi:cation channel sperm-associated protein subunit gamma-like [Polypterus senegalus]|uniref:cation channel sperm-associated protein subunit gamma-like n=1 Tax=Polypterus senegalus TaxID=55291 RepID=UPI001966A889|nr:cation channel sperm-associated protein subunit gamma-like [Polypterus senegalus]
MLTGIQRFDKTSVGKLVSGEQTASVDSWMINCWVVQAMFLLQALLGSLCLAEQCSWQLQVLETETFQVVSNTLWRQQQVYGIQKIMKLLVEQAVDPQENEVHDLIGELRRAEIVSECWFSMIACYDGTIPWWLIRVSSRRIYFGFPYYLKVILSCSTKVASEYVARQAFLTGMSPNVTMIAKEPVNPASGIHMSLELTLGAAALRDDTPACSSEMCLLGWYFPLPFVNGSVVYLFIIQSNGFGLDIMDSMHTLNINGYIVPSLTPNREPEVVLGVKVSSLRSMLNTGDPSRPLLFVQEVSPVLILGGVINVKAIIMTSTEYSSYFLIGITPDSCWPVFSICPYESSSDTITYAVATESTLFIRINWMLYTFTGNFSLLPLAVEPSASWTCVLKNVCVKKIVPVPWAYQQVEHLYIIGGGQHRDRIYKAAIKDGKVEIVQLVRDGKGPCDLIRREALDSCEVLWATQDFDFRVTDIVLVKRSPKGNSPPDFFLVYLDDVLENFAPLPGLKDDLQRPVVLSGLILSPLSQQEFLWGNTLLSSFDHGDTFVLFPGLPKDIVIKYFTLSSYGEFTFVTQDEQIWWGKERQSLLIQLRPSKAWNIFNSLWFLQHKDAQGIKDYSMVTLFYDLNKDLQELLYMVDSSGEGFLVKRKLPVAEILSYRDFYTMWKSSTDSTIQYKYSCPFSRILYQSTPSQESYSRIMYYHAEPPVSLAQSGFHSFNSIVVYQGLAYHLMRLHTDYSMRLYADPVNDPTYRWWLKTAEYKDFYRYLAGHRMYNKEIYVDMDSYGKDSVAILESEVPSAIYLDKGGSYDFALQLQVTGDFEQEDAEVTMLKLFELGISATVSKQSAVIINMTTTVNVGSRSMTYKVKSKVATMDKLRMTRKRKIRISDGGINTEHAGPGNSLIQTMLVLRVNIFEQLCFQDTRSGIALKNQISVPLYVGCRPDHRLVFDFERTVQYMEENKKKHRDCPIVTPLKPCFYFKDDFWPFFIVQDTVLSRSDPYLGSYTFKVIGGGPHHEENIVYYDLEHIKLYNTDSGGAQQAVIWETPLSPEEINTTDDGFVIFKDTVNTVRWLCQPHSPCGDIVPTGTEPLEFLFVIEVSTRGFDNTSYCEHTLHFVLYLHGIPISENFLFSVANMVHIVMWTSVVISYLHELFGPMLYPKIVRQFNRIFRRLRQYCLTLHH